MANELVIQDFISRTVSVNGLPIHFVHGGAGAPLVLIHGGGNDWHEWSANMKALSTVAEIFALDFPGFGLSGKPEALITAEWLAEFMKSFLDAVALKEAAMAGQSIGGLVAADFAMKYPARVKKLVLVDSAGMGKIGPIGWLFDRYFSALARIKKIERGPRYVSGTEPGLFTAAQLRSLKMPVLIVWGEKDHYFPQSVAVKSGRLIPNSQLHIFPGCRHAPQREDAAHFNTLVCEFLTEE